LNLSGNRKFLNSWIVILICLYGVALFHSYKATAKAGDFKRVASYIMNNEKPGEPILIFPRHAFFPLKIHYSGLNVLVRTPGKDRPDSLDETLDLSRYTLNSESQIIESLSVISGSSKTIPKTLWVVRYPDYGYLGVKYNIEIFDQFIEKNYKIKKSKSFFEDTRVMLVEKKHKPPDT
jgi:hypothetical protein